MMNIQTIIFIYLASAIAMPASGNDFPTHPLPHPTQNHTTLIENPPAVAPDGNPPQTMLRRGDRRSLAIASEDEHHPDKSYLLSPGLSILDTFSRALKYSKNLFGSNDNDLNEVRGHDANSNRTAFKKYPNKSCRKRSGMTGVERDDFFTVDDIDKDSCEDICRYSVNCFGWEYKDARGKRCVIWHGSPIDEHSVEEDHANTGADCYIKYQHHHESDKNNYHSHHDNNRPKKSKNKREKDHAKKGAKKHDTASSRSNDIFNIHNNIEQSDNAPHPCDMPCPDCHGHRSNDCSRGNYLYGFDCTNNRVGCMPGSLCRPSPLNGSDRWTCQ